MTDNVAVIREFIQAWSSLDADRLAGYFTEDGTYYNIPTQPISGRENVRNFIRAFLATWTETQWDIVQILGAGDLVFAERVDRTKTTQGNVDLPCVGVFEMADGKIRVWRDYFDLATFMNAMSS
jgi:limonene-1,2-epoxide hydrolase